MIEGFAQPPGHAAQATEENPGVPRRRTKTLPRPLVELLLDLLVRRITQMHAGSGLAVQPSSGQYCSLKEFEVAVRNHESKPGRADPEAAEGKRMRVSPIPFT
jgi:hypothetical protein